MPPQVGNATEAAYWRAVSSNVSAHVHSLLWDEQRGLYMDRNATDGQHSAVVASTALLPLWLDDLPAARLPRLLSALHDPNVFATKVPLPSVGRAMPSFGTGALTAMIGIWMIDFYERLGADLATLTFFIVSNCKLLLLI